MERDLFTVFGRSTRSTSIASFNGKLPAKLMKEKVGDQNIEITDVKQAILVQRKQLNDNPVQL